MTEVGFERSLQLVTGSGAGVLRTLANRLLRKQDGKGSDVQERKQLLENLAQHAIATRNASCSDNDWRNALVRECIRQGLDTRDAIMATVPKYDRTSYPGMANYLDHKTGTDPERHLWFRNEDKKYVILNAD